ncbi:MAG: manganese efflux pump MntP family protein [Cyclonatronaceae bacterium]
MTFLQLVILGTVIGFNNLAVAMALGSLGQNAKKLRIVSVFMVFEFLVPLLGLWLGKASSGFIESTVWWISSLLLVLLGIWTIIFAYRQERRDSRLLRRMTSYRGLVLLAMGLSIDNLIVGFSLGLGDVTPLVLAMVIAFFSGVFTWIGIDLGRKLKRIWENRATVLAGAFLIALGIADALGII